MAKSKPLRRTQIVRRIQTAMKQASAAAVTVDYLLRELEDRGMTLTEAEDRRITEGVAELRREWDEVVL